MERVRLAGSEPGAAANGSSSSLGEGGSSGAVQPGSLEEGPSLYEIVELKNTCPFSHSRR